MPQVSHRGCRSATFSEVSPEVFGRLRRLHLQAVYAEAVKVRPARDGDVAEIIRLKGELIGTYAADLDLADYPDWPERAGAGLRDLLNRDTHRFIVAQDDSGALIGCVSAQLELTIPGPRWSGVHGVISDMYVDPASRSRGVARAMTGELLAWCRERGCRSVRLHSTPMAVPVYERLGFHVGVPKPGDERFPVMWIDF